MSAPSGLPPLLPGEFAWRCDAVSLGGDGRAVGRVAFDAPSLAALRADAKRLYLEVFERGDGGVWLVHRGGWPFDLRTADGEPVGLAASALRPRGSGDEVMRDLIESFESTAAGRTLHVRANGAAGTTRQYDAEEPWD